MLPEMQELIDERALEIEKQIRKTYPNLTLVTAVVLLNTIKQDILTVKCTDRIVVVISDPDIAQCPARFIISGDIGLLPNTQTITA